ncbi:hypothetical protein G4228_019849 [Cervus hanglu yarkandensis]|uniref:G-protein coupled receptors family 1 profile domain-containing protein n=1 Tax=Cervus hanglu yarkandensis TaxID=84702 RepID=A0A833WGJ3_9CERV|nr:hypothetical protein G4228_019849 [Cervus hanglu yarkandensis]
MGKSNHTVTAFILVGFTTDAVVQLVPFVAVLGVYSMIVPGNTTLIVLIGNDSAVLFCVPASNVITPTVLILASYLFISATILKILSTRGCLKAFSTCSLHLISVTLFYGSVLYVYFRPQSSYSLDSDRIVSMFYTVALPVLNPMIYSLRNKDVKESLNKLLK